MNVTKRTTIATGNSEYRIEGAGGSARWRRPAKVVVLTAIVGGVAAVAAGGWSVAGFGKSTDRDAGFDRYIVATRSFTVDLREKGELKAAQSVDIKCEVEGRSTIISIIEEGTAVKKGDLLVELASDQLDNRILQEELKETTALTAFEAAKTDLDIQRDKNASDIRKAELNVELKKLALEKYTKGDWVQARRDAQIAIEQAEMTLQRKDEDFQAAKELYKKNFMTKTEFENDKFEFKKSEWQLEKSIKAREVLEQYTHVADLRQRQSDHDEAIQELERARKNAASEETKKLRASEGKEKELEITMAQLAKMREQRMKCRITAPTQGFVVYYAMGGHYFSSDGSGQVKEGASVHERQTLMQLPDTSSMQVIVRIHEAKTNKINVGQSVLVEVEGIPDRTFTGTVTKIAVLADTQNRWLNPDLKEYETEITLDPTDAELKPGVTAHCRILVTDVVDKLAVPVQTIYAKGGARYVFRDHRGTIEPTEVQVGSVGSEWAEITGGLNPNDRVLLAITDDMTRMIPDPVQEQAGKPTMARQQREAPGKKADSRGGRSAEGGKRATKKTGGGRRAGRRSGA